jgi:hypothetical protein
MIVDQLTPLLPKDSEEVNAQVKRLQAMLDTTTMVDVTLDHRDRRQGQDPDHCQSSREDSGSSITPPSDHDRDRDEGDLRDIIRNRDARDWIENRCQERDHIECEQHIERDYDYYGPYYDHPH